MLVDVGGFFTNSGNQLFGEGAFRWQRSFRGTKTRRVQRLSSRVTVAAFIFRFVHHKMTLSPHSPRSRNSGSTSGCPV